MIAPIQHGPIADKVPKELKDFITIEPQNMDLLAIQGPDRTVSLEAVAQTLVMDYREAEKRNRDDNKPMVTFSNIRVSKGHGAKFSVNFTRTTGGIRYSCWYQFIPGMKEADFSGVSGARIKDDVFAVKQSGKLEHLGTFGDIIDESPQERIAREYSAGGGGAKVFDALILHNDSGDDVFGKKNGRKLVLQEAMPIEEYLEKGTYVIIGYDGATSKVVRDAKEAGALGFVEIWQSDATFAGHVDPPDLPRLEDHNI